MNLLILYICLNIVNVILQTARSLTTIKCGKTIAALVNAVCYGVYTIVIVYTNSAMELWIKVLVTALANLVGVYVVKLVEEKRRKDKLWKVEVSVLGKYTDEVREALKTIPYSCIENLRGYTLFNVYCATQKESQKVKRICEQYNAKYFASETKIL